jgi:hypothetical protein
MWWLNLNIFECIYARLCGVCLVLPVKAQNLTVLVIWILVYRKKNHSTLLQYNFWNMKTTYHARECINIYHSPINRINNLTSFLVYSLKAARHGRIMNEILPNVELNSSSWKVYPITSFLRWCVSPYRVEFEWLVSQ